MAVTRVAFQDLGQQGGGNGSVAVTLNASTDGIVVLWVQRYNVAGDGFTIDSPAFDGDSITTKALLDGGAKAAQTWGYLAAPTTGSSVNLTYNVSGTHANVTVYLWELSGMNQTTPESNFASDVAWSSNNYDNSIGSLTSGEFVISAATLSGSANSAMTLDTGDGAAEIDEGQTADVFTAAAYVTADAATEAFGWSWTQSRGSSVWGALAIAEEPAAATDTVAIVDDFDFLNRGPSSGSFSFTLSANVNYLVVRCYPRQAVAGNTEAISAADYNGDSLTVGTASHQGRAGVQLLRLANPDTGASHTLTYTVTGNCDDISFNVLGLEKVNASDPVGTEVADTSASATATSASAASSESGGLVVDALQLAGSSTGLAADGGQTEQLNEGETNDVYAGGSSETGAASVSMGWSWDTARPYAYRLLPLKPQSTTLAAPTLVSGTLPSDAAVQLSVTGTEDMTAMYVHRVARGDPAPTGAGTRTSGDLGTSDTTWTDTGVSADTLYDYYTETVDAGGSNFSASPLQVDTAPAKPTSVTVTDSTNTDKLQVQLAMPAGSDDDSALVWWRESGSGDAYQGPIGLNAAENEATFWIEGLAEGTTYEIAASAIIEDSVHGVIYSERTTNTGTTASITVLRRVSGAFV